jgi:hypothetical protein
MLGITKENEALIRWVSQALNVDQSLILKKSEVVVETPWSIVLKIVLSDGEYYLKKTPPDLFIETTINEYITSMLPDSFLPKVFSKNKDLACFLTKSAGDISLRKQFNGNIDRALLAQGIKNYLNILRALEQSTVILIEKGVPDWRLEQLPKLFSELLEKKELVDEEHMTVHDINALLDFLPEIERICKKSADFGIQQTLINADFNENNVILNKTTNALSIIDWGESVISHPFLTIASHLRSLSRRYNLDSRRGLLAEIKEVCFSCWSDLASQTACAEIYEDILKLQPVFSALAIKRLQSASELPIP